MIKEAVLVLALAACVSAAVLPVRRIAHSGPLRKTGLKQGRIVGGKEAEEGQFPYSVSIQWQLSGVSSHFCGGALVKDDVVVTAGQCAHVVTYGLTTVVAGRVYMDESVYGQSTLWEISHPEYKVVNNHAINDIAVFTLTVGFDLSDKINVIGLPSQDQKPYAQAATLSGWGSTSNSMLPETSDTLHYAEVTVIPTVNCYALMTDDSTFNNNNICSGPVTGKISSCVGDIGSPLVQYGNLIGVVSWNTVPCGTFGMPIVYTRVSAYSDWIKEYMDTK
uniref:Serine protease-like protein 1 n=1 Tax=Locusta migratoria TaxID=7004 RepID=X5MBK8_LOCMI|nr:TPA_exp: serine protease-like protein 1 [Locusta migratoria]